MISRNELTRQALQIMRLHSSANELSGDVVVSCPFHIDKTPSLSVNADKGIFHCFSCGRSGSVEKLYKEYTQGRSLYEALGLKYDDFIRLAQPQMTPMDRTILDHSKISINFDTSQLGSVRNSALSKAFLRKRGITFAVVDKVGGRFSEKIRINKKDYDNVLIFPIYEDQKLISLEIRDTTGKAAKKVLYPSSSSVNTLYDLDNLDKEKDLYVVEGLMDLLAMRKYPQLQNSTTIFGASLTTRQIHLLRDFSSVVYIPDNDQAGEDTIQKMIGQKMYNVSILRVPSIINGKDISDVGDVEEKSGMTIGDLIKRKWLVHKTALIIK